MQIDFMRTLVYTAVVKTETQNGSPKEAQFQVVSQEKIHTRLGIVVVSTVISQGSLRTIYSHAMLHADNLKSRLADIESAKRWAADPKVVAIMKEEGTTPQKLIQTGADLYLRCVETKSFSPLFQKSALTPLMKQQALERLVIQAQE